MNPKKEGKKIQAWPNSFSNLALPKSNTFSGRACPPWLFCLPKILEFLKPS